MIILLLQFHNFKHNIPHICHVYHITMVANDIIFTRSLTSFPFCSSGPIVFKLGQNIKVTKCFNPLMHSIHLDELLL